MKEKTSLKSWILLACLTLIWGSSYILMKKALLVYTPVQMAALRLSIAGLACTPLLRRALKNVPRDQYFRIFCVGMLGSGFSAFLFAFAMTRISSSVSGIINSLSPLFTVLTGLLFWNIITPRSKVIGILLGFIGAIVLVFGEHGLYFSGNIAYAILPVIATFLYGTNSNFVRQNFASIDPILMTTLAMTFISIPAFGILLATDMPYAMHQPGAWVALGYVAILGVCGTVIANTIFYMLVQLSGPLFASAVTYLMPIVAIAWGIMDGETLAAYHLAGLALILTGVYFVGRPVVVKTKI